MQSRSMQTVDGRHGRSMAAGAQKRGEKQQRGEQGRGRGESPISMISIKHINIYAGTMVVAMATQRP